MLKYPITAYLTALSPGNCCPHRNFLRYLKRKQSLGARSGRQGGWLRSKKPHFCDVRDLCAGTLPCSSRTPVNNFPRRFCLIFSCKATIVEAQVSPVIVILCGTNSKIECFLSPKELLPRSFQLIVEHEISCVYIAWTLDHDGGPMLLGLL